MLLSMPTGHWLLEQPQELRYLSASALVLGAGRENSEQSSDLALYRFVLPKKMAMEIVLLTWMGEDLGT